ncbi:MAG: hypothetical protein LBN30_04345 [Oscillospiraceae bacterium]|jgi:hypothetical protein|nr:hypothetical protein [Oscillospiraceae bacterium]
MAKVLAGDKSVFRVRRWLGLNENPDGDTQLAAGEAAEMRNFRVTRDGNLQLRPGYRVTHGERTWGAVRGVWTGRVGETETCVFASGGHLWSLEPETGAAQQLGGLTLTDDDTHFFGFDGKLYALTGHEYAVWDGVNAVAAVEGYRPLVAVATAPTGGGTQLEQVNKLTGARRVWLSPNGTAAAFQLPEAGLASVDYVRSRATGANLAFTANVTAGTVTLAAVPAAGTNSVEVGYTHGTSFRAQVEGMRVSELFNGANDNRVFLCGDGSNRLLYSGLDYDGRARADYFPDLNVLDAGSANEPVTSVIRDGTRLDVFKTDSCYTVRYGTITLESGAVTAAFYLAPASRAIGNDALGQTRIVNNCPRTLWGGAVYEWRSFANYADDVDESQTRALSGRVHATLSAMSLQGAVTFDDYTRQEYYILEGGRAVVNSYATDTWFVYTDFPFGQLFLWRGGLYGCLPTGDIAHISRRYASDGGAAISAFWRSGSLSFDAEWRRKYTPRIFVTMKPEPRGRVEVTARTNRRGDYEKLAVSSGLATLADADFRRWSFGTNREPQTAKLNLRARKFTFLQLVLESDTDWSSATIVSADIVLRRGGDVRN